MANFADRYGIPAHDVENLSSRFKRMKLKEGFGSFDKFLKFCSEVGYKHGMMMRKYDPDLPHSPDNTVFRYPGEKVEHPPPNIERAKNHICAGCKHDSCTASGAGCAVYRKAWAENWNKNIHRKKAEPADPNKTTVFRYEHPDLIREGIIFAGGTK